MIHNQSGHPWQTCLSISICKNPLKFPQASDHLRMSCLCSLWTKWGLKKSIYNELCMVCTPGVCTEDMGGHVGGGESFTSIEPWSITGTWTYKHFHAGSHSYQQNRRLEHLTTDLKWTHWDEMKNNAGSCPDVELHNKQPKNEKRQTQKLWHDRQCGNQDNTCPSIKHSG